MMYKDKKFAQHAKLIVADTAAYIRKELGEVQDDHVEEKELNSLVSYVDKTAESMLVETLSTLLPKAGFITEEETEDDTDQDWTWIIDPLDGTTNFLYQIPYFCVSVALQKGDEVVMGIVHDVMHDQQFFAAKGEGATVNEQPIHVTAKENLADILVATGFPYNNDYNMDSLTTIVKNFLKRARGIRRLGAAALDLCFVAAGRLGAYYETSLNAWDVAAGALIVKEAGGLVTDFEGGDDYLFGSNIVACPEHFHKEILEIILTGKD